MIPQNWVEPGKVEPEPGASLKNCYPNCVWSDDDDYWLKMDSLDGEYLDGEYLDGEYLDGDSFAVVLFYFVHWLHRLHWLKMDLAWFVAYHWGPHFNSVFHMLYYAIHLNTYHEQMNRIMQA